MTRAKSLPVPLELYLKLRHSSTFPTPMAYLADEKALAQWSLDHPLKDEPPSQDEPNDKEERIARNGC